MECLSKSVYVRIYVSKVIGELHMCAGVCAAMWETLPFSALFSSGIDLRVERETQPIMSFCQPPNSFQLGIPLSGVA